MGRAARAKKLRRDAGHAGDDAGKTGTHVPAGHDHPARRCRACQGRETRVAALAHRIRQQNDQILKLQTFIDEGLQMRGRGIWPEPGQDRTLPGRADW